MMVIILGLIASAAAGSRNDNKDSYRDQYCTDPRTMKKHAAYSEWADAYSCTRHRCQPGGRNLAIYTVGCKRVEAPESAIECEEVVEDTNMQFPFCCTRLRCLVVVRGEVWTRVLGQPWEVLPAAPWSHMYKMKKPPPPDASFLPKTTDQGPVYELTEAEADHNVAEEKIRRSTKKHAPVPGSPDCNDALPVVRAAAPPDIVIALSTNNEVKDGAFSHKKFDNVRRTQMKQDKSFRRKAKKFGRKTTTTTTTTTGTPSNHYVDEERERDREKDKRVEAEIQEFDEPIITTEKPPELSEEKTEASILMVTPKQASNLYNAHRPVSWTELPQEQWTERETTVDMMNRASEASYRQPSFQAQEAPEPKQQMLAVSKEHEKPANLQALVDAIGSRMKDIENVVQKMSEKVHPVAGLVENSNEGRFSIQNQGSQYLHSTDSTTEQPLFIEDTNLTGYFSDASNSILRRNSRPKQPPPTYMAPVEDRRKASSHIAVISNNSDDAEKKRKKHAHKRRRGKAHAHKKHHMKDENRKHFNRLSSREMEKNLVSLEDSSQIVP